MEGWSLQHFPYKNSKLEEKKMPLSDWALGAANATG
jgi:hypothetical protein